MLCNLTATQPKAYLDGASKLRWRLIIRKEWSVGAAAYLAVVVRLRKLRRL